MCGIIAVLSNKNIYDIIIHGLKQLQNRGYDSVGVAYIQGQTIIIHKDASDTTTLALEKIKKNSHYMRYNSSIHMSMAHTRWATNGKKNKINAHPHISYDKKISIIHNGIIGNYNEIKTFLQTNNIECVSETDSEVIAHLIAYHYDQAKNIKHAITQAIKQLEGTWALIIMCVDTPDILYGIKYKIPLLLGYKRDASMCMFASELSAFDGTIEKYIIPNNNEIISVYKGNNNILYDCCNKTTYSYDNQNKQNITPAPYTYWFEKEINEQYTSIKYIHDNIDNKYQRVLETSNQKFQTLYLDNIILLGCGTSYYAAMLGEIYLKDINYFSIVRAYDASNFTKKDIPKKGRTGIILLSQSGETKDLLECLTFIPTPNILTISIVNNAHSQLFRKTDIKLCIQAGREVSVPSTKSFTGQLFILKIMANWFNNNNIRNNDFIYLYSHIEKVLDMCTQNLKQYVPKLIKPSMFVLGKGKFYPLAKEAALKIKEVTYIHAEGYPASALKHGPYSLLEPGFPVILFIMDDEHKELMMNCYHQILARGGFILVLTDITDLHVEHKIVIPHSEYNEILAIIVIQYLSFYIGKHLTLPIDTPRNLAKCVTTD